MDNLQWYDYVRFLSASMCLVSLYFIDKAAYKAREKLTQHDRDRIWVLNALLLLFVEGSIEQVVHDIEWGPRTLLALIVAVICLRGVLQDKVFIKTDRSDDL